MGRLTYKQPDGSWGVKGLGWERLVALPPQVYGALAKLKDVEELIDEINDPASGRDERDVLALRELLALGEMPADHGEEGYRAWLTDRFLRAT